MRLPSELVKVSAADDGFTTGFRGHITVERRVHTIVVIVNPELFRNEGYKSTTQGSHPTS